MEGFTITGLGEPIELPKTADTYEFALNEGNRYSVVIQSKWRNVTDNTVVYGPAGQNFYLFRGDLEVGVKYTVSVQPVWTNKTTGAVAPGTSGQLDYLNPSAPPSTSVWEEVPLTTPKVSVEKTSTDKYTINWTAPEGNNSWSVYSYKLTGFSLSQVDLSAGENSYVFEGTLEPGAYTVKVEVQWRNANNGMIAPGYIGVFTYNEPAPTPVPPAEPTARPTAVPTARPTAVPAPVVPSTPSGTTQSKPTATAKPSASSAKDEDEDVKDSADSKPTSTSDSSSSSKVEESSSSKPASSSESGSSSASSQNAASGNDVEASVEAEASAGFPWATVGMILLLLLALLAIIVAMISRKNRENDNESSFPLPILLTQKPNALLLWRALGFLVSSPDKRYFSKFLAGVSYGR